MPRRRSRFVVDMFPFLSVLCSVIGVLMLFIVLVMSTRVIEADEQARFAPSEVRRGKEGAEDGVDPETYQQLEGTIAELTGHLARRKSERDALAVRQQELLALIESKVDDVRFRPRKAIKPIVLDAPEQVNVIPDGDFVVTKTPIFVEVKDVGYVVYPEKTLFPPVKVRGNGDKPQFTVDPKLERFLKKMESQRERSYLLMLIHPNGVEAYDALRRHLIFNHSDEVTERRPTADPNVTLVITRRVERINVGYEPFSRDWEFIASQTQE